MPLSVTITSAFNFGLNFELSFDISPEMSPAGSLSFFFFHVISGEGFPEALHLRATVVLALTTIR